MESASGPSGNSGPMQSVTLNGPVTTFGGQSFVGTNFHSRGGPINFTSNASDEEDTKCLQAFYYDYQQQKDLNPDRVPSTCEWFLQNQTFVDWRDGQSNDKPILWVFADPGTGKSVLAKTLVQERQVVRAGTAEAELCYFFFKDNRPENRKCTTALRSILHQLFRLHPALLKHARQSFKESGERLCDSSAQLLLILDAVMSDPDVVEFTCVLDGFDECDLTEREKLVEGLKKLTDNRRHTQAHHQPRFIIISRPYEAVERTLYPFLEDELVIKLSGTDNSAAIQKEILAVIISRVERLAKILKLDPRLESLLLQKMLAVTNKTYLWAHLVLSSLKGFYGSRTKDGLEIFLSKLPTSVVEAYDSILDRSCDVDFAKKILQIVLAAERPLATGELQIALCTHDKGLKHKMSVEELDTKDNFEKMVRENCGLMIAFYDGKAFFIHQTVKEYFRNSEKWLIDIAKANVLFSRICITYLLTHSRRECTPKKITKICDIASGDCVWEESDSLYESYEDSGDLHHFWGYCRKYWGKHTRGAGELEHISMLDRLLKDRYKLQQLNYERRQYHAKDGIRRLGLFTIAVEGLEYTFFRWTKWRFIQIAKPLYDGLTVLYHAINLGHGGLVERLFRTGRFNLNSTKGLEGHTPLTLAVRRGHIDIVRFLLRQSGIKVNARNKFGVNALYVAVMAENDACVKSLLRCKGVDIMVRTADNDTPLFLAIRKSYHTPLFPASRKSDHSLLTALLSSTSTKVNRSNSTERQTVLNYAVQHGGTETIEIILAAGFARAYLMAPNGYTALEVACFEGRLEITRNLLRLEKVDINRVSLKHRLTPLMLAIIKRSLATTQLLLDTGKVKLGIMSADGLTARGFAVLSNDQAIIKLLEDAEMAAGSLLETGSSKQGHTDYYWRLVDRDLRPLEELSEPKGVQSFYGLNL